MKVLVTAATKYGATGETAQAIGETLREHGLLASVVPPEEAAIEDYDAVVLGGAVYAGHWLRPARALVDRAGAPWRPGRSGCSPAARSATRPSPTRIRWTWPTSWRSPGRANTGVRRQAGAQAVELRRQGDRAVALRAPEGDFRDWAEVKGWAGAIAEALRSGA